jgi:hypothetical protein
MYDSIIRIINVRGLVGSSVGNTVDAMPAHFDEVSRSFSRVLRENTRIIWRCVKNASLTRQRMHALIVRELAL